MAAKKLKTSEKAAIITKLTTLLKKKYGGKLPKTDRGVLETYMFAACLEDNVDEAAEAAYAKLLDSFHDLNEIRVSTVREIERPLDSLPKPEFRAMRIREGLQCVFEKHFAFDLDGLRKKNQENASSDLGSMTGVTPFIKLFTLQMGLDVHVLPIDDHQLALLRWLGLVDKKTKAEAAADELKGALRKNDGPLFAYLLRQAANDLAVLDELSFAEDDDTADPAARVKDLGDLLDGKRKPAKPKKATKKAAAKKTPAKKSAAKKAAPKKTAAKKAPAKKPAKKAAVKKKVVKKKVVKKAAAKKKAAPKKKAASKKKK